jgi:hypothetical protein
MMLKLPHDIIENIVFISLVGDGKNTRNSILTDADVRRVLYGISFSCRVLRDASSIRCFARKCLSSPRVFEELLLAQRRVALHRFLRLSGGYSLAVQTFLHEIELLRAQTASIPLPIVAMLCRLSGRLFAQISAYSEVYPLELI